MEIKIEYALPTLIVKINGEIDHHTASRLRDVLDREIDVNNIKNLVLDFKEVTFMDSSGIGIIVGRFKKIDALGGKMLIVRPAPQVDKILEISGIKKILSCKQEVKTNE